MSVMFGVWPPQGKVGAVQSYGRLKAQVQMLIVDDDPTIVAGSDIFNNVVSIAHTGVGDYLVTLSVDLVAADVAHVEPTPLGGAGAITAVAENVTPNTIQVLTFDAAGAPAERNWKLSVFG